MPQLYDSIGAGYAARRRPEPRIAAAIAEALGGLGPVVNVGAGTGSYEPDDRAVVAVEPSETMIRQRREAAAPVVRASATSLPFRDGAFAAATAILTIHHWDDRASGLAELVRVARERIVVVTVDVATASRFWLVEDYFPAIAERDRATMPPLDELRRLGAAVDVRPLPVPHDCADGFLGAYWRRPDAYLDSATRGAISAFAGLSGLDAGLERLGAELADGTCARRYGRLTRLEELDLGYRLVVVRLG